MLILKLTLPQWASLDQPQNPEENPPHWGEKTGEKIHKHKSFCKKPLNIDINIDIKPITTSRSKAKHQNFGVSPGDLTGADHVWEIFHSQRALHYSGTHKLRTGECWPDFLLKFSCCGTTRVEEGQLKKAKFRSLLLKTEFALWWL